MRPAALALLLLAAACAPRPEPFDTFNTIPPFTLTDQTGSQFSSEARLKGRVWIADFIFTTCNGPCPRMSAQMKQLQSLLADIPDISFISFTVDPDTDTPPILAAYARRFLADPNRWFFLTGPKEDLHRLSRDAFLLGDIQGNLDHSTRFVLVDRHARVRRYYETNEDNILPRLAADARALARQNP